MPEQTDHWSAARYETNAWFVSDLGAGVVEWLDPQPGERILDLGCGDGALTETLLAARADVIGTDASADMVAAARARGVKARVVDGHVLDFEDEFDAVFSNAALHWMIRPDAVIAGVAKALRPGGRFVAEFGGHGNVAAIRVALAAAIERVTGQRDAPGGIWYFPSCAEHRARLEAAGFTVKRIALIPRPTPLPSDMAGWQPSPRLCWPRCLKRCAGRCGMMRLRCCGPFYAIRMATGQPITSVSGSRRSIPAEPAPAPFPYRSARPAR